MASSLLSFPPPSTLHHSTSHLHSPALQLLRLLTCLSCSPMTSTAAVAPSSSSSSCVRHVLVVGGSGFIGSAVCRSALRHGLQVTSLSQSGRPPFPASTASSDPSTAASRAWTQRVTWRQGDVLQANGSWTAVLSSSSSPSPSSSSPSSPIDGVVCCVGGFGSVDFMRRVNGDANVNVLRAMTDLRLPIRRFAFVSAYPYQLPKVLESGYIEGKRRVEAAIADAFPSTPPTSSSSSSPPSPCVRHAVIARPGLVYGPRYVRSLDATLPLQWLMGPLSFVCRLPPVAFVRQLPLLSPLLTPFLLPPVSVDSLADALIERMMDPAVEAGVSAVTVDQLTSQQPHAKTH